jgi:predicted amidohydrolase YtcJ
MSAPNTIFLAKKIVTMNGYLPEATAVAVREGKIVCVGTLEECQMWGKATVDDTFRDHVLVPGFVEGHGHTAQGTLAIMPNVGYYDTPQADGSVTKGIKSYDELIARLKEIDAGLPPGEPLYANGFDPIYFTGQPRLDRTHLDKVSTTRQVVIRHASGHLATANSLTLKEEGITRDTATPGVVTGPDGEPSGELQEAPAMGLAKRYFETTTKYSSRLEGLVDYGALCRNAGVTTSTELVGLALLFPGINAQWQKVVDDPAFPARMILYNLPGMPGAPADYPSMAKKSLELKETDSAKYRTRGIKLVLDGSIQGWTAAMLWPGYMTGEDQGLPMYSYEDLAAMLKVFHQARLNVHAHCNGNAVGQQFIDAVEDALIDYPWLNHRHTLSHSQTTTAAQYKKMGRLGMCCNIFTNHMWYWGDQHYEQTMGPELTKRMWACKTALREGVNMSFHSDAGVTPVGHLMTMWCAVNRLTPSGRVLGEAEKITPYEALYAATLGCAYQLHLDHELGSIEAGKWADFAVLDASPLDIEPLAIREINVWGTVVGGVKYEGAKPQLQAR